MSTASHDDPSSTAFDLFDRWMTNRETPKAEETAPASLDDFVIPDTKASREAARARLEEAARLEREGLLNADVPVVEAPVVEAPVVDLPVAEAPVVEAPALAAVAPVEPPPVVDLPVVERPAFTMADVFSEAMAEVAAAHDLAAASPETPADLPDAVAAVEPVVEPVAVVEPEPEPLAVVEPEPVALPEFVMPTYRPPHTEAVLAEPVVETPVVETPEPPVVAPVAGKRRAAVATDSAPVVDLPVEGKRRRHVSDDAVALTVVEAPVAEVSAVETPVIEAPVADPAPAVEAPVADEAPAETPSSHNWAAALAKLVEQEPEPEPEPASLYAPVEEPVDGSPTDEQDDWDPLTSPLRPQDLEAEEPTESMNLRLIVNVLMIVAILGAGVAGYFLFRGEHWALKPTAALTALGTFLTTARFTF